jgi:CheY-like chemotaxis protein
LNPGTGEGNTASNYLRVVGVDPLTLNQPLEDTSVSMSDRDSIVLYVEDEEFDRFLMSRAFAKGGLGEKLKMVNDGQLAVDYLSGSREYANRQEYPFPAMVLLDLHLPELHGFDVLKWIRSHPVHSQLPVVVFSSSEREEDRSQARELGANEFVQKPGSGANFHSVVENLKDRWLRAAPANLA